MADPSSQSTHPAIRSPRTLLARLSAMMFLQYWPLGIWGVTVGTYIAANTGGQGAKIFSAGFVGYSTAAGAIGSLLSPVLFGFLSDRHFAAQRLLACLHMACAIAVWNMYESRNQAAFFFWLLLYFQCFSPAVALTNKIALKHLANSDAEYPLIRIFSTIGWISAGLLVGLVWPRITGRSIEATATPLLLGAVGSLVMAAYSLTLPATPPQLTTRGLFRDTLRDATALVSNRPLFAFLLVAMLASVPSMAYNNFGNLFLNQQKFPRPAALMTLGQLSDLVVLSITPWLVARLGLRPLFMAGIAAWGVRYTLLAIGSQFQIDWTVYVAILIHGCCFVFVYVVGVMYVDHLTGGQHRGIAQGLYALVSGGIGNLLGALSVGVSQATFLTPQGVLPPPYHWAPFWIVPAIIAFVTLAIFSIGFTSGR